MQTTATKSKAATNAAEPTFELNNRAYVLLQIMVAHDEFNSPEEAARYCTAGAVASLIESMKRSKFLAAKRTVRNDACGRSHGLRKSRTEDNHH